MTVSASAGPYIFSVSTEVGLIIIFLVALCSPCISHEGGVNGIRHLWGFYVQHEGRHHRWHPSPMSTLNIHECKDRCSLRRQLGEPPKHIFMHTHICVRAVTISLARIVLTLVDLALVTRKTRARDRPPLVPFGSLGARQQARRFTYLH